MLSRAAMRITSRDSNATPNTSRSKFMTLDQNHGSTATPQIPMGPPEGPMSGAKAIFWNERELRAGWRLLIYLLFVVLFTLAGTFLATALHFPQITRAGVTATSMLVQECLGLIAVFA